MLCDLGRSFFFFEACVFTMVFQLLHSNCNPTLSQNRYSYCILTRPCLFITGVPCFRCLFVWYSGLPALCDNIYFIVFFTHVCKFSSYWAFTNSLETELFGVACVTAISAEKLFGVFGIDRFQKYLFGGNCLVITGKYRKHETLFITQAWAVTQDVGVRVDITWLQQPKLKTS